MIKFDVKKPRFRSNSLHTRIVSEKLYKRWKAENPELSKKINSYNSFKKYWVYIATEIQTEVCNNPLGMKLPYYCGELTIKYVNTKNEIIREAKSYEYKKDITYLNWNTSERVGKLVWNIEAASKFNWVIKYYGFKGVRRFNIRISEALNTHPEIFKSVKVSSSNIHTVKKEAKGVLKQRENEK